MIKLFNANIYTMEDEYIKYNQLIIKDDKIFALGSECDNYDTKHNIDLKGDFVFPGFVDAHTHMLGLSLKSSYLDLSKCETKEDVFSLLKSTNTVKPVITFGLKSKIVITNKELDNIIKDQIAILRYDDYHSYIINTFASKHLNIETKAGFVTDSSVLDQYWSKKEKSEYEDLLTKSIKTYYKYGITGVHTEEFGYYNGYHETRSIYENVLSKYPLNVHMLVHYQAFNQFIKDKRANHPLMSYGAIKVFIDGTLSSKTANISIPYKNTNNYGVSYLENVEKVLMEARLFNKNIAVHTIGDQSLSDLIELLESYPVNNNGYDRIIHASLVKESDIERLANLKVVLDIQPQFISSDKDFINNNIDKSILAYPLSTYFNNDILMTGGSDAPVEIPNPLLGIFEASNPSYQHHLSRFEAIKLYCSNPYFVLNNKKEAHLQKGALANLSIFNKDILTINKNELLEELVSMTIVNGKIVYNK